MSTKWRAFIATWFFGLFALNAFASADWLFTYLSADPYDGTEYISRKIVAAAAGIPASTESLIASLLSHQNADGGFGELPGYQSTAVDTAFALEVSHAQSAQLRWQIDDAIWSLSRQLE